MSKNVLSGALVAFLLSGCLWGEDAGEVRIDAFSYHWRELKARADSVDGGRIYTDGVLIELKKTDLDKTGSLPKVVEGESQGTVYLHFPLKGDSRRYTCEQRMDSELTYMDSTQLAAAGLTEADAIYTVTAPYSPKGYLVPHYDVTSPVRDGYCTWVPGLGLYLGAGAPFEGEILVKY